MMKKFGMIVGLMAVLMCAPAVAWAEESSVRVDAQEVPVNGNWFEYKMAEGEYVYCPIVIEDNGRLDVSVQINFEGYHYVGLKIRNRLGSRNPHRWLTDHIISDIGAIIGK